MKEDSKNSSGLAGLLDDFIGKGSSLMEEVIKNETKEMGFIKKFGLNPVDLFKVIRGGAIPIPEETVNHFLKEHVDNPKIESISISCFEGKFDVSIRARKGILKTIVEAPCTFSKSNIDQTNQIIEIRILNDVKAEGRGILSQALVAMVTFIIQSILRKKLADLTYQDDCVLYEKGLCKIDISKIDYIRPIISTEVAGTSFFDLMRVKEIRSENGQFTIQVTH